jgi:hypothetical protein
MQPKPARQFFQFVKIVADGRFRPQPLRLGHANRWSDVNLYELGGPSHQFDFISSGLDDGQRPIVDFRLAHQSA